MSLCDYCQTEQTLYPVFGINYTELFHICLQCQSNTFLCSLCQQLRDNEESIKGYCVRHTKYYQEISDKITDLQNRITLLESKNI